MANPILGNDKMFQSGGYASFDAPSTQTSQQGYGQPAPSAADLNSMYSQPPASNASMGRMTYEDVIMRTSSVFGLLVIAFAAVWFAPLEMKTPLMLAGGVVGFVLGLVNAFKKKPVPALIVAYSAAQGLFLGGISYFFERAYPGIVLQAVLATLSVFAAVLIGFRSGKLRTSPKLNKIFFIAMIGYGIFSLVNLGMVMFGGMDGWGMRSGPLGIAIGVFAVILAAYSLVMDFENVKHGVENGVPREFAWKCAFALLMTLIWMYMEILRILAILRGSD